MNYFGIILFTVFAISCVAILIYDYHQHKKCNKCGWLVILRVNNHRIRQTIKAAGINICWCAAYPEHNKLMTTEGDRVCGFNEDIEHVIEEAKKKKTRIVDCGVSVKKFIYEVKMLQEIYKENAYESNSVS